MNGLFVCVLAAVFIWDGITSCLSCNIPTLFLLSFEFCSKKTDFWNSFYFRYFQSGNIQAKVHKSFVGLVLDYLISEECKDFNMHNSVLKKCQTKGLFLLFFYFRCWFADMGAIVWKWDVNVYYQCDIWFDAVNLLYNLLGLNVVISIVFILIFLYSYILRAWESKHSLFQYTEVLIEV